MADQDHRSTCCYRIYKLQNVTCTQVDINLKYLKYAIQAISTRCYDITHLSSTLLYAVYKICEPWSQFLAVTETTKYFTVCLVTTVYEDMYNNECWIYTTRERIAASPFYCVTPSFWFVQWNECFIHHSPNSKRFELLPLETFDIRVNISMLIVEKFRV